MIARRNEVMPYLQRLAPSTVAFLQVPLSPARAARLADFTLRTGIDAQTLVIDLLDDLIFALDDALPAPSREPSTSRE